MSTLEDYTHQATTINNPQDYVVWLNKLAATVVTSFDGRSDENHVAGCSAPVWIWGEQNADHTYTFHFTCDSKFVNGIGKILTDVYNGKTREEIMQVKFRDFDQVSKFLLFERKRSFQKFINRIYSIALSS